MTYFPTGLRRQEPARRRSLSSKRRSALRSCCYAELSLNFGRIPMPAEQAAVRKLTRSNWIRGSNSLTTRSRALSCRKTWRSPADSPCVISRSSGGEPCLLHGPPRLVWSFPGHRSGFAPPACPRLRSWFRGRPQRAREPGCSPERPDGSSHIGPPSHCAGAPHWRDPGTSHLYMEANCTKRMVTTKPQAADSGACAFVIAGP